ncbi:ATP-dependent endonuclease [Salinibacterium sp. NK8237]|uniref:ATP-dependent nuclease n=1 Tax=Salinibacterium sp. NK8237 TaxID=2792038 RepID=UPI0018CF4E9B|nr:AAA family ATPase [Salinibacterium sp. NK8237]MBH0130714.1 AAA family ATPase [Salinibacterium sp. NK8237]
MSNGAASRPTKEYLLRLVEATIQNYRSIGAQTRFQIDDLTTLVGPNNEGKTNLLRALGLGMNLIELWSTLPSSMSSKGQLTGGQARLVMRGARRAPAANRDQKWGYSWEEDYPISKQEKRGTHPTVLRLKFSLTPKEVEEFTEATGISNNGELPIEMKLSKNAASFGVIKPGKGAATHKAKAGEIAQFITDRLSFVLIPAVRTDAEARAMMSHLAKLQIQKLTYSEEYKELTAKLQSMLDTALGTVGDELTESIKGYLPSIVGIEIKTASFEASSIVRDVQIDDGVMTSLAHKGDGVKSLVTLALIQELAKVTARSNSFILLVDEPEAHLHSFAVHELQILFQELSETQQVILATHNPIFVNRDRAASNLIVRRSEAKIARNLSEIREAIGVQLHDNLESAETVVLVEGLTDATLLSQILAPEHTRMADDIRSGRVILKATKGSGKLRAVISKEKSTVCRIIVVLDNDEAGRAEAAQLRDSRLLKESDIFMLGDAARKSSEIEDLLEPASYLEALSSTFDREFNSNHFKNPGKKWSQNLAAAAASLGIASNGIELEREAKIAVASLAPTGQRLLKPTAREPIQQLIRLVWPDADTQPRR